jgi:gamma-tubulin complex component 2
MMTRTRSPSRRSAAAEKSRTADGPKQRVSDPRPREARQETPVPGTPSCCALRLVPCLRSLLVPY